MNKYIITLENSRGYTVKKEIIALSDQNAWELGREYCIDFSDRVGDETFAFSVVRKERPGITV